MRVMIDNPRSDWFGLVGTMSQRDYGPKDLTLVEVHVGQHVCMFYRRNLTVL